MQVIDVNPDILRELFVKIYLRLFFFAVIPDYEFTMLCGKIVQTFF